MPHSRGSIALFVKCLHLLDLDLLDDWPSINEETFSAKASSQSIQARLKGVEWSLYRLFELYDPLVTQYVGFGNNGSTVH